MARVTVSEGGPTFETPDEVSKFLAGFGIWYRTFEGADRLGEGATDDEILAAYAVPVREAMERGGYVTADVIDVGPATPNVDALLAKFNKEHWHSEDEVRFVVRGRGIFHIHPLDGPVFRIEVGAGDMIGVPRGTRHWFDLCAEKRIRAIRLFQDKTGWTPYYTDSRTEAGHAPLCFGPSYLPGAG